MLEGYHLVARLQDIPDGGCLATEVSGTSLVLVRVGSVVRALENRCPHAGAPLSEGFVEGERLTCSWHGWTFDLGTGQSPDDPDAKVPVFDIRIVGDEVHVRV